MIGRKSTIESKAVGEGEAGGESKAVGAMRPWAVIRSGASHIASARYEFKSLALIGASVAVLYFMALSNPAEPYLGAGTEKASFNGLMRSSISAAPESLTAMIPNKDAVLNEARPESVASLINFYQNINYRLDNIRLGETPVPRIQINKLPADFAIIQSAAKRKLLFIKLALPLILYANERITIDRARLIALRVKITQGSITPGEQIRLDSLAERYGLKAPDIDTLLLRVDMIPPSLALAQGAEESGWGTSRFVREGNALFGQHTFKSGTGLVPKGHDSGATYEVKSFKRLIDSVFSYMTNLNTHNAYDAFRRIRAGQRASGVVDSNRLVGALHRYSERGEAYVETIRSIINKNELWSYDRVSFSKLDGDDSKI